jgi:hypothetical protein
MSDGVYEMAELHIERELSVTNAAPSRPAAPTGHSLPIEARQPNWSHWPRWLAGKPAGRTFFRAS